MAITTTSTVKIGRLGAIVDFTSRLMSYSTDLDVDWGRCAPATATVTLKNFDGALTPGAGGTYASLDWFKQALWIYCKSDNGSANLEVVAFAGLINDIRFDDDGKHSTVTITAVDAISKVGQGVTVTRTSYTADTMGDTAMEPLQTMFGATWPKLTDESLGNQSNFYLWDYGASTVNTNLATGFTITVQGIRAYLEQTVLPVGGAAVMWPRNVKVYNSGAPPAVGTTEFEYVLIMKKYKRDAGYKTALTFDDYRSVISGGDLPFQTIEVGFTTDELINTVSMQRPGGTLQTATNATSTANYGTREVRFTNIQATTNAAALDAAQAIRERFKTPTFAPLAITTKASTVAAYAANDAYNEWATVLGMAEAPYQQATITWTATGGSSQSKTRSVRGRRIVGTPDDLTVTIWFTYPETT